MKCATSLVPEAAGAVAEIRAQIGPVDGKWVIFFASAAYDPVVLSAAMQQSFPTALTCGCTTAGEIGLGRMTKHSLVAMVVGDELIEEVAVEVVTGISARVDLSVAMGAFEKRFGEPAAKWRHDRYVGLVLIDGLSLAEERINDAIGNVTDVSFIGGSAGDDLAFKATHVFADGRAYGDAAVLVLLKTRHGFGTIKTQSFRPTERVLVATRVNEATREVLEFDGRPAAQVYAEAVGAVDGDIAPFFQNHPVGLMLDGEPYVRSPQQRKGDAMAFYCNIAEGMELTVLEGTSIVDDTRAAIAKANAELGGIAGMINFNCILRTLEIEQRGLTEAYGGLFADIPTVGFSTYGESLIGHINQTATILAFKNA